TMPAKMMNANPGLKDISHSITGGAIGAQGYWVPFEAAKAIAATFCWEIRYVLTPVFGLEFPSMCTEPDDPAFLRFSIDRGILLHCTQVADANRAISQEASQSGSPRTPSSSTMKSLRPKPAKIFDSESGYCTDTDRSLLDTPQSGRIEGTPIKIASTTHLDYNDCTKAAPAISRPSPSSPAQKSRFVENKSIKRLRSSKTRTSDGTSSEKTSSATESAPNKRRKFSTLTQEARAAYTLMQLHMADAALAARSRPIYRRASH
ncbi:MAG: hypothetical protein Q9217_005171, partial [Psora testacea]